MNEISIKDLSFALLKSWDALYCMARDGGCTEIARQVARYIEHYGGGA